MDRKDEEEALKQIGYESRTAAMQLIVMKLLKPSVGVASQSSSPM